MTNDQRAAGPRQVYETRAAQFAAAAAALSARSSRLTQLRTAVFLLAVAAGLVFERTGSGVAALTGTAALIAFIVLVGVHRGVRRREEWQRALLALNREGVHRLDRSWDELPRRAPSIDTAAHAYAGDLDLHGRASLTQILGPVGSAVGAATLDAWLLEHTPPAVSVTRQAAVRELAPLHDLREALAVYSRRTREVRPGDVERFLAWAESEPWFGSRIVLRSLGFLLPAATWILLLLQLAGIVQTAFWLVPALASLVLYVSVGGRIRSTFDQAFGREGMFTHYPHLIAAVTAARFSAPLLRQLARRLGQDDEPADRQLERLRRLMHLADLRLSSLHLPVFLFTLWDFHVLTALERWQRAHGASARDWLSALGELEALSALATLAHDQPEWTFAEFTTGAASFHAAALGHPLLSDAARVTNDVVLGPPGTFLLVTGSNMSGKSTLLRSIGLNVVLAQAGAPACAATLRLTPFEVHSSIRVQDSLARGVSYFMAELERLKQIVDAAHRLRDEGGATLLFLLDEILHGTNTAERRIAARRVIRHLVDSGAIGAATTHDLELAEEPDIAATARLVHFREVVSADRSRSTIEFDYLLREGLATSTNALELMRIVGLPG